MEQQLAIYKQKLVQDYSRFTNNVKWQKDYAKRIYISEGRKYYKVTIRKVTSNCSKFTPRYTHSFIVKQDCAKFSKGDILKPASWRQAETNFTYGNILKNFTPLAWEECYNEN